MFVYATAQQRKKSFTNSYTCNDTHYINSWEAPAYCRFQHHCTLNSMFGNMPQVGNWLSMQWSILILWMHMILARNISILLQETYVHCTFKNFLPTPHMTHSLFGGEICTWPEYWYTERPCIVFASLLSTKLYWYKSQYSWTNKQKLIVTRKILGSKSVKGYTSTGILSILKAVY